MSLSSEHHLGNAADDFVEKNGIIFYRGARPLAELEIPPELAAEAEDYDWAMQDPNVRQEHGGLVVAVRHRKIWGVGENHRAAWEQANTVPGCPGLDELLFVVVPGAACGGLTDASGSQ
jgi:hypothetical protein